MSDQKKNQHYGNEKRTSFHLKFLSLYLSSLISISLSLKSLNVFELYDFILSKYDEDDGEKHIFWNHYDLPRKRYVKRRKCRGYKLYLFFLYLVTTLRKTRGVPFCKYIHIHIRDVFRTYSNILGGTFCQNKSTRLSQLFSQKHPCRTANYVLGRPLHIWRRD